MIWRHSSLSKAVLPWDRHKRNLVQSSPSFEIGQKICTYIAWELKWNDDMNSAAALIYYTNSNVQANRNERDIITIKIVGAKILIFKIFFFLGGFVDIKLIRDTKDPISHLPISEFVLNKKFRRNASKIAIFYTKTKMCFSFFISCYFFPVCVYIDYRGGTSRKAWIPKFGE